MKLKLKKGITFKLFIITSTVFIIFISTTLIFQSFFFEKFYMSKKENEIKNNVEKFIEDYGKTEDENSVSNLIKDFEENGNSKIVIMDNDGKLKFITKSRSEKTDALRLKIINGIIYNMVKSNTLNNIKNQDKVITFITDKKEYSIRNMVCLAPDKGKNEMIFAITSLQPINEAVTVIKEFYLYFYIVAVILIIILSFIYSNMIVKPLIELNDNATEMAKLNFSKKCNVKSNDEIGNLAQSLNSLSENLSRSMSSLKQANRKLEEDIEKERALEKMRKEFVAAVSHELKTPISLIEGFAEGIKDGVFEKEQQGYYMDVIIDESKKMGNLVKDMLDLSQLESGSFKLRREDFYIDELLRGIIKKFSSIVRDKNIEIISNIDEKIRVNADRDRIEQVVTNFITNAIRYTSEKGTIDISVVSDSDKIRIEIENTGDKIEPMELDLIWDNFYKVDKSRNRKSGGTGLGLAIVKNIILLHEGEYGVQNTEKGVKFYFSLKIC